MGSSHLRKPAQRVVGASRIVEVGRAAWVRGQAVVGLQAGILFGGAVAVAVAVATVRSIRAGSWTAWSEYTNNLDTPYRTPCAQREREQITALSIRNVPQI